MTDEIDYFVPKTTPYLRELIGHSAALAAVYAEHVDDRHMPVPRKGNVTGEDAYTPYPGIVQKYAGRAILLLTYTCAAHCRYCQRQDRVGRGLDAEGRLTPDAIKSAVSWFESRPDIQEVILTGGDPFTYPQGLRLASEQLAAIDHIKVLRAHTRFPLQYPTKVDFATLEPLARLPRPYFLGLHVDHSDELTPEASFAIERLRKAGFILRSQTVFLKGVNDSVEALGKLFWSLYALGVTAEYIYHCISVSPAARFVMRLEDEVRIMSELRQHLSGNAYPHHMIHLPGVLGKITLPTNYWGVDLRAMRDFNGVKYDLDEKGRVIETRSTVEVDVNG